MATTVPPPPPPPQAAPIVSNKVPMCTTNAMKSAKEKIVVDSRPAKSSVQVDLVHLMTNSNLLVIKERLAQTQVEPKDMVIVFDFDMTLKFPNPETGNTPIVRDTANTLSFLEHFHQQNCTLLIATAVKPSHTNWSAVSDQLTQIGANPYFGSGIHRAPPEGISTWQSETGKFKLPCWYSMTESGSRIVCGNGILLTHYEKAAGVMHYINLYKLAPKLIVFVDDYVVNAWMFGMFFAALPSPRSIERITSVWWEIPPTKFAPSSLIASEDSHEPDFVQFRNHVIQGFLPDSLFAGGSANN
eukprot:c6863_g1_i2.p1 GENE.c6863_g1_i2~~c6863_g1_i2.p1  ORF type:complete len:349 (-),score=73.47 c6863_g1_i2:217-1116(-)